MNQIIKNITVAVLILIVWHTAQAQDGGSTDLYVSKKTGEFSIHKGESSKTTDKYENGNVIISKTGPILYSVDPNDMAIGPDETKSWEGQVYPDAASAPEPGTTATGSITGNYTVQLSRPAGTGSGGSVLSTYNCNEGEDDGCSYHGSSGGTHEIVEKTGSEVLDFTVYSIKVTLPDTICLSLVGEGPKASGEATPTSFPDKSEGFEWSVLGGDIQIDDPNAKTVTLTINDTTISGSVKVKFTIEGVSYTAETFVKYCSCSCKPIQNETFGPLGVTFTANPASTAPSGGLCEYSSDNAAFTLEMQNDLENKSVAVENASLSFKKDCKTGEYKDVSLNWTGDKHIGSIKFIDASVTGLSLNVNTDGELSGSVTLKATLNQDKDLTAKGIMMLRQGIEGSFKFDFSAGNDFSGDWNFAGVEKINIDIVKGEAVIGKFEDGALDSDGKATGTFEVVGGAQYKSNLFTVTMKDLSLGVSLSMEDGFELLDGSGGVTVSEMKGVTGTADLDLDFKLGNCKASLGVSDMKAFTMTFNKIKLTVDFNSDFDMVEFDGSLDAKHDKFDAAINVATFNIKDGELKKFEASGKVKYNAFTFELIKSTYQPVELTVTAKVELNVAGNHKFEVDEFKIDEQGNITVGKIAGELNKTPMKVTFNATFKDTRFKGGFTADLAKIGMDGNIDVGSEPSFSFCYLKITAHTDIPLGQSGLKLTKIGGEGGFNYELPSTPKQGSYLVGLTLGVADIANMCEVIGNPIIQLNNNSVAMTLKGNVNVLKNNTFFAGKLDVTYKIPDQTLDGSVGTDIKVPSSGFIFTSNNLNVNFHAGGNSWWANGSNMGGSMFNNVIQLSNGNIYLSGSMNTPTALTGNLKGMATASLNENIGVSKWGMSINGNIQVNMNSNINAAIDQNGLNGSFGANVNGSGTLGFNSYFYNGSMTVSGSSNANVGYQGGSLSLYGDMTINLPISICVPDWSSPDWYTCHSSFTTYIDIAI